MTGIVTTSGDWKMRKGDLVLIDDESKVQYKFVCGADHRASPDDVVDQVNGVLEATDAPYRFIYVADGSDCYWFALVDAKSGKPWKQ